MLFKEMSEFLDKMSSKTLRKVYRGLLRDEDDIPSSECEKINSGLICIINTILVFRQLEIKS